MAQTFGAIPQRNNSDKILAGWFNQLQQAGSNLEGGNAGTTVATVATAGGATVLTYASANSIQFTGTQNQSVQLPDATTLAQGRMFRLLNRSTGAITVYANDGTTQIGVVPSGNQSTLTVLDVTTTIGAWDFTSATASTSSNTALTQVMRDVNSNFATNNVNESFVTTTTANALTTLTVASPPLQQFTGTLNQTLKLPAANTLPAGCQYFIFNRSTGTITVQDGSGATIQVMAGGTQATFTCAANGTVAGTWDLSYTYTGPMPLSQISQSGASVGQAPVWSGTAWVPGAAGGSGQGAKNYIANYNFETNSTANWSLAHSALSSQLFPTSVATAGTALDSTHGGSAAAGTLSFSPVSAGKLAGSYSGSLASSAATTAGDLLISSPCTIDIEDQAKVLAFKFAYKLSSGTATFAGNSTNTWAVWIYDVTNGTWIQPAGVYNLVQSSGVGIAQGTFQTPSNMTQFQLALVNINATGAAVTLLLDDISVGPQTVAYGPAASDWQAFTPTGSWATNSTYTGFWRRVGDSMEIQVKIALSGAPNAVGLTLNLPSGYTLDSTKISVVATFGVATAVAAGLIYAGSLTYNGTTISAAGSSGNVWSNTSPGTFGSGDQVRAFFTVPIQGWSSNSVQSSDTDTRVVSARYDGATCTITSSYSDVTWLNKEDDSHAFVSGTTITTPVSGRYDFTGQLYVSGTAALNNISNIQLVKNGATTVAEISDVYAGAITTAQGVDFNFQDVPCNAGDTFKIQLKSTITTPTISASTTQNYLQVRRNTGPAVVAATESVNAHYSNTAGSTLAAAADIPWTTKEHDTHGWFDGTTFTAGISGKYRFVPQLYTTAQTLTAGQIYSIEMYKNGSFYKKAAMFTSTGSTSMNILIQGTTPPIALNAGDTVKFRTNCSASITLLSTSGYNFIGIDRVGN